MKYFVDGIIKPVGCIPGLCSFLPAVQHPSFQDFHFKPVRTLVYQFHIMFVQCLQQGGNHCRMKVPDILFEIVIDSPVVQLFGHIVEKLRDAAVFSQFLQRNIIQQRFHSGRCGSM